MEAFAELIAGEVIFVATADDGQTAAQATASTGKNRLVGFVSVWAAENFIHHLYVDPAQHGHGIGSTLLAHCRAHFGLPLSLKCAVANTAVCRFYERHGFALNNGSDNDSSGISDEGPYFFYQLSAKRHTDTFAAVN